MIVIKQRGGFSNLEKFLNRAQRRDVRHILEKYAKIGVDALSSATPYDTGKTSESWGYNVTVSKSGYSIAWTNTNVVNGVPIAIILQYGHGTRNGGYVQGQDYINSALRHIFDNLAEDVWREVTAP